MDSRFCELIQIVSRALTAQFQLRPIKEEIILKDVACLLCLIARKWRSGALQDNNVENGDKTHFVINMNKGRTFGFIAEEKGKWVEIPPGGMGWKIVVRTSDARDVRIKNSFLDFKNKDHNYPIRRVSNNVVGVPLHTGPKGRMGSAFMAQWLQ